MNRKMIFCAVLIALFAAQAQNVFANHSRRIQRANEFRRELDSNNLRNIERFLSRRVSQMDLPAAMHDTIQNPNLSENNRLEVLRLLVRHGADVNRACWGLVTVIERGSQLANAVRSNRSVAVIRFLLDSGATAQWCSRWGGMESLLVLAYGHGNIEVVNLLLDRGRYGGQLLPTLAARGDNDFIRHLINRGLDIRTDRGAEALREAAHRGRVDTAQLLIANGVNINARDADGRTALMVAYDRGEMEVFNFLLANGAIDFERRQAGAQGAAPAHAPVPQATPAPPPAQVAHPPRGAGAQVMEAITPRLQNGRYRVSGSAAELNFAGIAASGIVTFRDEAGATRQGTFTINGDRLTINLGGRSYFYTITSNTSFEGHGQQWFRVGI